jgi:Bacitracin resistance protein BacA/VTT domain
MVAGLVRGLSHEDAARFSFLLATPVIMAAGVLKLPDLAGPLGAGVRGQVLAGSIVLFTAGLFAAAGASAPVHLSLPAVILAAAVGATVGAETGYALGRRAGPLLLRRDDRPRLQEGAERSGRFLERYGHGKAIVLARFVPVVVAVSLAPILIEALRNRRARSHR